MIICIQAEVTLFGPHDTSRGSEIDRPQDTADGKPGLKPEKKNYAIQFFLIHYFTFLEVPVKEGILFSEEDHKMDVDEQKISSLLAPAKITLFQVNTCLALT